MGSCSLILYQALLATYALLSAAIVAEEDCNSKCGNVDISYPFSTKKGCFKDPDFQIICRHNSIPYRACYDPKEDYNLWSRSFWVPSKFGISKKKNKFNVVGCNSYAFLCDRKDKRLNGCDSRCNNKSSQMNDNYGSCQNDLLQAVANYTITIAFYRQDGPNENRTRCSYAFIAQNGSFNYNSDLNKLKETYRSTVILDWVVDNTTSCGCKSHNAKSGTLLVVVVTTALLVVFLLLSISSWAHKQRTVKQLRQRNFDQNGGNLLLQQLSQQGYTDRTKIFTEVELKNATSNFDESKILGSGGQGTVYKGILPDNTLVAIKKPRFGGDPQNIKSFIVEVFVLSQINHRHVVKLLGCCLETEVPLLVYEFVDNGSLLDHLDTSKNEHSITWETRLRIATETAEAISYLHSAASIPIIHRDIKSANILLDHNDSAKVSDFGASRLVPLDEAQVATVVQGTIGYLDPEYIQTGQFNEKSDVYSFGIVLVELLTGKKAFEFNTLAKDFVSSMKEDHLWEILDKRVLDQKKNAKQLKEVALLARRCITVGEERPTMKEVAMELEGLMTMEKHLKEKNYQKKGISRRLFWFNRNSERREEQT